MAPKERLGGVCAVQKSVPQPVKREPRGRNAPQQTLEQATRAANVA